MSDKNPMTLVNVSAALRNMLVDAGVAGDNQVLFDAPGSVTDLADSCLLVYLYSVSEDPNLRNYEEPVPWLSASGAPGWLAEEQAPPTVLDLHYLFVPYSKDPANEMMMIGGIKRLFRNRTLVDFSRLQDIGIENQVRIVPENPDFDSINHLWSLFTSAPYKLSLFYMVTPVLIRSDETFSSQRVAVVEETYYRPGGANS